jgi:hypothetical protein
MSFPRKRESKICLRVTAGCDRSAKEFQNAENPDTALRFCYLQSWQRCGAGPRPLKELTP